MLEHWAKCTFAWALYLNCEQDRAQQLVEDVLDAAHEVSTHWVESGVLRVRAYFCFRDGDERRGLEYLAEERSFALSQGYVRGAGSWAGRAT